MSGLIVACIAGLLWLVLGIGGIIKSGRVRYVRFSNTNEKNRNWLVEHLARAKKEVMILSGHGNPRVYNEEMLRTMSETLAANPQLRIRILVGSPILTLGGQSCLYETFRSNGVSDRLCIGFLRKTPVRHFRVVDNTHLFVEDPHGMDEQHGMVSTLDNSFFRGWQYGRRFERIWSESDRASKVSLIPLKEM